MRLLLITLLLIAATLMPAAGNHAQGPIDPVEIIRLSRPTIFSIVHDTISWSNVQHAETYRIRWRPSSGGQWTKQIVSTPETSFRFTELSFDVEFRVQVQARSSNPHHRDSIYSQSKTIFIPKPKALAKPKLRRISGSTVAWDKVTGAISYVLQLNDLGEISSKRLAGSSDKHTFPNFRPGRNYEIRIRALGDSVRYKRRGPWSDTSRC